MNRVLFASTALVAFAGAAAADVTITGDAEMGIFDNDNVDEVQFHTDIDVTFTMSGETDGGLTFGASIDLDESDGDPSGAFGASTQGGETIFLSGGFGTLTLGDTDGALDWAMTEILFNSGSLQDDEETAGGYNGNGGLDETYDGQIMRYDYTFGDYGVAVSAEIDDTGDNDPVLGIGFRASFDFAGTGLDFGIGYQEAEDDEAAGMSLNANFGSITAGLNYSEYEIAGEDIEHIGVGVGYSSGPISLHANYGEFDREDSGDSDGYAITAGYDLGGGAIIQLGYGSSDFDDADDYDSYSFGVRMNF